MTVDDLENLNFSKKLLFAYLTCERLIPNYKFFSEKYGFGDYKVLEQYLESVLEIIINGTEDLTLSLDEARNRIDKINPFPENYDTVLASSAMDACGSVLELLQYIQDKQDDRIVAISTLSFDTVDMYIQEIEALDYNNDSEFEKKIAEHPLMQSEKKVQDGILKYLSEIDAIHINDILTLEGLQNNNVGSLNLNK